MFVKSIDATAYTKTGDKLYELLDSFVEEIGEQNVVQLVTDNGNLMLEDIGKIPKVKRVIERGISLVGYIYNHTFALNMMRKNTGNVELVRHGVTSYEVEDMVRSQLGVYKSAGGLFGIRGAIRQRATLAPAEWWRMYGSEVPDLQLLAIKVLGLTCSASGCERNWSTFEHIHSEKRSRLEHKRLEDLVFVKYNQSLTDRYNCRDKIDPMVLNDVNYHTEWFLGELREDGEPEEELVFENDNLTWDQVADASRVNDSAIYTRRQRAKDLAAACASKETMAQQVEEEGVEEIGDDVEDNQVEANGDYDEEDDEDDF
ncbi:hypothetical protein P8452_65836 [Trifolium repens]|nr:hypothetical protein P8452_65836 [Trifolium repens]